MTNARPPRKPRTLVPAAQQIGSQPAPFTSGDAAALQALAAGTANDGQQKQALKWILEGACQLPVWTYGKDERETNVALGRQYVGQQIMGVLKVNLSALRKREQQEEKEDV